jgi:hypothetical protein
MIGYFYIVILGIYLSYGIVRYIYLFIKGQYNPYPYKSPYPYKKGEKEVSSIISFCSSFGIIFGALIFAANSKLLYIMNVVFLCYSFCLIICVSVLNYLSFKNIKDQKIIFQTALFDIMVIIISIGIWKL